MVQNTNMTEVDLENRISYNASTKGHMKDFGVFANAKI